MEESVMESESAEPLGSTTQQGVSDAWETVTAALVREIYHWTQAAN